MRNFQNNKLSELAQLGVDVYRGNVTKYSKDEAHEAFRLAVIDLMGGQNSQGNFYAWQENKYKVFNLISEVVTTILPVTLSQELDNFAEVRNANWGDQLIFEVTDPAMFPVAIIADGTRNVRRRRLDGGSLKLTPKNRAVGVYEEFYRFLAGRTDWAALIDRVSRSFLNQIRTDIYTAITGYYSSLSSTYGITGTFNQDQFNTLVQHVEAGTGGMKPVAFGTKLALAKVIGTNYVSYNMMDEINRKGFLANFQGTDLVELMQAHVANTDNFALDNQTLLIVPSGVDKLVKIGFEGSTLVFEEQSDNKDLSMEFTFIQKYDVGVLSAGKFGIYKYA